MIDVEVHYAAYHRMANVVLVVIQYSFVSKKAAVLVRRVPIKSFFFLFFLKAPTPGRSTGVIADINTY